MKISTEIKYKVANNLNTMSRFNNILRDTLDIFEDGKGNENLKESVDEILRNIAKIANDTNNIIMTNIETVNKNE